MKFVEEFEISVRCPVCGEYHSVFVEKADYWKWIKSHLHVQGIFPYLSDEEREILISGICPDCGSKMFKEAI